MWHLAETNTPFTLWFSDGNPIGSVRGGSGLSSRLIVDQQGFLDLTEMDLSTSQILLDANGSVMTVNQGQEPKMPSVDKLNGMNEISAALSLTLPGNGSFSLALISSSTKTSTELVASAQVVSGQLKPFPEVSAEDAAFISNMITEKYIPYQDIPDAPGKTVEQIKQLGQQFFPFSPYSFQLAMCVYDWTTASFTRMVFMKIFQYTGVPPPPFPIDQPSIAMNIWGSNWGTYTPQNPYYMNSFMMIPASSEDNVVAQLSTVAPALQNLSEVENRVLSAAIQSLPRISFTSYPQLFSGQVDIYQLGISHFGIEFLQCPLNSGPINEPLMEAFTTALSTFLAPGNTITTKMVWSFTDNAEDAIHYSNGILIVANAGDSAVWDTTAYITPLSDDPSKTEYTFMPGSQFEVQSISQATISGKEVTIITVQPLPLAGQVITKSDAFEGIRKTLPTGLTRLTSARTAARPLPHTPGKTAGRRCDCTDVAS